VRTAISRLISASGMTGASFGNCMDLFNGIVRFRPDCIILDLYMPGLDGLEVMNYLRKNGEKAPIVLVTAQDDPALREICLKAGASAFMRKPLPANELLDVIAELVQASPQDRHQAP
jgi:FixJ family two-component response regulator